MVASRFFHPFASSAAFALACLGAAALLLGLVSREEPSLAASSATNRSDLDRDGLGDLQELVIGTLPNRRDTDGDMYTDLEERARGSDPVDPASMPDVSAYSLGTCASQENGFISMLSAVYANGVSLDSMDLRIGMVHHGRAFMFAPRKYTYVRGLLRKGRDAADTLAVVEVGIPESVVRRLGQVNLFSLLSSPGQEPIVSILPIVSFSGVAMSIEQRATLSNGSGGGVGVLYRPLAADDQIPSTWTSGQICFQGTSAVGMSGVSIVFEVNSAGCIPMDTYCSPGDCSGGVGKPLSLPDPAALAGG
jgi:hypothetical protein